jgi:AraC-like DNA-binding protein
MRTRQAETLEEFYKRIPATDDVLSNLRSGKELGHFNVYRRDICRNYSPYNRRDFYKISLIIGKGILHYASKGIEVNQPALLFSNPNIPYSWEATTDEQGGYFCLFTEAFINNKHDSLADSPLFKIGGDPVFFITESQQAFIAGLFENMLAEMASDYLYKYDLLRNYVNLIIHEALKLQPAQTYFRHTNAATRIAGLFIELLERQFPIDSPDHVFKLKTANDFATRLSVHVNHLNRAVKEITGRTTTEHIAERVIKEAQALLKHTDWTIAEIAYSLGFEYPSYFNNFFKKQTGLTPKSFRD